MYSKKVFNSVNFDILLSRQNLWEHFTVGNVQECLGNMRMYDLLNLYTVIRLISLFFFWFFLGFILQGGGGGGGGGWAYVYAFRVLHR